MPMRALRSPPTRRAAAERRRRVRPGARCAPGRTTPAAPRARSRRRRAGSRGGGPEWPAAHVRAASAAIAGSHPRSRPSSQRVSDRDVSGPLASTRARTANERPITVAPAPAGGRSGSASPGGCRGVRRSRTRQEARSPDSPLPDRDLDRSDAVDLAAGHRHPSAAGPVPDVLVDLKRARAEGRQARRAHLEAEGDAAARERPKRPDPHEAADPRESDGHGVAGRRSCAAPAPARTTDRGSPGRLRIAPPIVSPSYTPPERGSAENCRSPRRFVAPRRSPRRT